MKTELKESEVSFSSIKTQNDIINDNIDHDQVDIRAQIIDCRKGSAKEKKSQISLTKGNDRKKCEKVKIAFKGDKFITDSSDKDRFISSYMKLECDMCHNVSVNFSQLKTHYRLEHQKEGFAICCGKQFLKRNVLIEHINLHLDPNCYKCQHCNKTLANRRCLISHMKFFHLPNEKSNKSLECDVCNKVFQRANVLKRHKETHVTGSKDYTCSKCGKK